MEAEKKDFWENSEKAAEISKEISDIKEDILLAQELKKELEDIESLEPLLSDEDLASELEEKIIKFEERIKKEEFRIFLSGKYDKNGAILQIFSGAGGVDAQDWAAILYRMYERYCLSKEWQVNILDRSFGEGVGPDNRVGLKSATMEIKGKYAYGFLKNEIGVHRLVRISPFSAKELRHTSFALIEVLPHIEKQNKEELEIKESDIRVETMKSSGPGGQNVNKRETAVRIIHISTNITVVSQSERSQNLNKEKALGIIYSKLLIKKEEEKKKELESLKGKQVSAEWGNQIRNYVLHPYKQVKDLRTKKEIKDVEAVLDGELDEFIISNLKNNFELQN